MPAGAERLLPDATGTTYVDREVVSQKRKLLSPPSKGFHVYCSKHNPGAEAFMAEVSDKCGFDLNVKTEVIAKTHNVLYITSDGTNLSKCDHVLLYLTSQTWTRGEASAALGSSPSTEPRLGLEPLADPWLLPAQITLPSHR